MIFVQALALLVCIGFSFYFSASETALFSLNRMAIERLTRRRPGPGGLIASLLSDPPRLLISIVMGNMLVNIGSSSLAERIAAGLLAGTPLEGIT